MNAGRLRHRVEIEALTDVPDGQGGMTRTWTSAGGAWADIRPVDSKETFYAGQLYPGLTHSVRMRFTGIMNATSRLKFGSRILNVIGVRDRNERREELMVMCAEKKT